MRTLTERDHDKPKGTYFPVWWLSNSTLEALWLYCMLWICSEVVWKTKRNCSFCKRSFTHDIYGTLMLEVNDKKHLIRPGLHLSTAGHGNMRTLIINAYNYLLKNIESFNLAASTHIWLLKETLSLLKETLGVPVVCSHRNSQVMAPLRNNLLSMIKYPRGDLQ